VAGKALVLNGTYEPLGVVPIRRAVLLVLARKAEILHANGALLRSERLAMPSPSVVRLRYVVRAPMRVRTALSSRAVFARDRYTCQYCGAPAETVDHVVPRSRGGAHDWENVVAACRRCNGKKQNRLPHEAGLRLLSRPSAPRSPVWLAATLAGMEPEWEPYLARYAPREPLRSGLRGL
jgi:5-methylcytosine-specific restriction endonuclease McrA